MQISTVGARLPGLSMHGRLRDPRTAICEFCGTAQYNASSGRGGESTAEPSLRSEAGRNPVVHGALEFSVVVLKERKPRSVPSMLGTAIVASAEIPCGRTTRICSRLGL